MVTALLNHPKSQKPKLRMQNLRRGNLAVFFVLDFSVHPKRTPELLAGH